MKKPQQIRTLGKTLQISAYKLAISQGLIPHGLSDKKIARIKQQVAKMKEQQLLCTRYQPFTSKSPKRKPRQVGA